MRKGPLDKIETELVQATLLKGLRLLAERMASKAENGVVFKVLAARGSFQNRSARGGDGS